MTDRRDPDQRREIDWRKLKQRIRVLEEERGEFIERYLADRLRHVDDFERFIQLHTVVDATGRIDWVILEQRLTQLLRDRPELAP